MSSSAQKLLALADKFEKNAIDHKQPPTFDEDYKKYKEMLNPTPKDDEGAYEKWLKDNSTFEDTGEPESGEDTDLPLLPPGGPKPEADGMHQSLEDVPPELLDADTYMRAASSYEQVATQLLALAKEKKEKKKLDPKAKVRNRGTVCVPASSAKDKKDHFPINDADQARNALARVHQYDKAPPWYSGSLKSLQELVSRKVHSKYPGIGKDKKSSKKSSVLDLADQLQKYAQGTTWDPREVSDEEAKEFMKNPTNTVRRRNAPAGQAIPFNFDQGKGQGVTNQQPGRWGTSKEMQMVAMIQDYLQNTNKMNIGPAGVDGKLGPATTTALRTFQSMNGIQPADGSLNKATLDYFATKIPGLQALVNPPTVAPVNLDQAKTVNDQLTKLVQNVSNAMQTGFKEATPAQYIQSINTVVQSVSPVLRQLQIVAQNPAADPGQKKAATQLMQTLSANMVTLRQLIPTIQMASGQKQTV